MAFGPLVIDLSGGASASLSEMTLVRPRRSRAARWRPDNVRERRFGGLGAAHEVSHRAGPV